MIQSIILQAVVTIIKILPKEKKGYEIFIIDVSDKWLITYFQGQNFLF